MIETDRKSICYLILERKMEGDGRGMQKHGKTTSLSGPFNLPPCTPMYSHNLQPGIIVLQATKLTIRKRNPKLRRHQLRRRKETDVVLPNGRTQRPKFYYAILSAIHDMPSYNDLEWSRLHRNLKTQGLPKPYLPGCPQGSISSALLDPRKQILRRLPTKKTLKTSKKKAGTPRHDWTAGAILPCTNLVFKYYFGVW